MDTIFLKLLNMSINAGWLILAVILLRFLLKKAPAWISCLLWALTAIRLVCPFSLESIFSLIPSREPLPREITISPAPVIDSGLKMVDTTVNPVLQKSFTPAPGASANPMQIWLFIAGIIWAAGVCILLLYAAASSLRLYLKLRTAVRLQGHIYLSEFIDTPFIFGVVRPRIYLPSRMPEELRAPVIAHEQTHLDRLDCFWKMFGYILLAVYWFHPLCWAAYALFCRDLELACDEKVIKNYDCYQKKAYSEALLACSLRQHKWPAYPLAFGELNVKKRIQSIMNYKKPAFWAVIAAFAVCAAVAVCFLTDPVKDATDSAESAVTDSGTSSKSSGRPEDTFDTLTRNNLSKSDTTGNTASSGTVNAAGIPDTPGTVQNGRDGSIQNGGRISPPDGQASDSVQNPNTTGDGQLDTPGRQGAEDNFLPPSSPEQLVSQWTNAFVSRDGNGISSMASAEVIADLSDRELLSGPEGGRSFGESSPWPLDAEADVKICSMDSGQAEINYYAWTSEPHVTVWKETIRYESVDNRYVVTEESLLWLDDISTAEAFGAAYGNPFSLDGSRASYLDTGAWENLNLNAMLSSSMLYQDLFEPESAAVKLLNLSDDPAKVKVERMLAEEQDTIGLEITFLQDDTSVQISMSQPSGENGIWVPLNYRISPLYRLSQVNWDEVRKRRLPVRDDNDWWNTEDIILFARIPDRDISIYGYSDAECFGQGIAIDLDGKISYFDWSYTTPQCIAPEFYWNDYTGQLQASLHIYTGTGVSADELHILQQDGTGALQDNAFTLDDYISLLEARIGFTFEEATETLTLFDRTSQEELWSVKTEGQKVTALELGCISEFTLGSQIFFRVEPGYFPDGAPIAWYEGMPALDFEIRLSENNGHIQLELGNITVNPIY